ncbi:MAG: hypothetical protein ACRD4D_01205 [Candidatus Acidiferrales bacterium]
MPPCLQVDTRGRRCPREANEDGHFCDEHAALGAAGGEPRDLRRLGFRLAALILLVIFLLPLAVQGYRMLRALLN